METGVLQIKEYGRIEITLRQQMDARGITRNRMARMIDVRYEVIDKWYKGTVERIDADILARLCFVLGCGAGGSDPLCHPRGQRGRTGLTPFGGKN